MIGHSLGRMGTCGAWLQNTSQIMIVSTILKPPKLHFWYQCVLDVHPVLLVLQAAPLTRVLEQRVPE